MQRSILSKLLNILFIDIETVPKEEDFDALDPRFKELWLKKARIISVNKGLNTDEMAVLYNSKAAIYSEFGKIVCISMGYFLEEKGQLSLKVKSLAGEEKKLLHRFVPLIEEHFNNPQIHRYCGHNIREFDIPYLCRRLLINSIRLPDILNLSGKKPWELNHLIDTMDLWKFGDYKHFTSMDLLSAVLGIPSPKDTMDGSEVRDYFYSNRLDEIVKYCEKDVLTTVKIYLRLLNLSTDFEVINVTNKNYD
ncbi:3'-5' exonuclease [Membranihabitans maritimus]|uniref:3'-5' exonuclease n=1 Tax=Membranihabitans maritimus TaxID=2904244 RepID=UPI001F3F48FB|nr:3'-5' exonuclease [Membranihabitans maritimus]